MGVTTIICFPCETNILHIISRFYVGIWVVFVSDNTLTRGLCGHRLVKRVYRVREYRNRGLLALLCQVFAGAPQSVFVFRVLCDFPRQYFANAAACFHRIFYLLAGSVGDAPVLLLLNLLTVVAKCLL